MDAIFGAFIYLFVPGCSVGCRNLSAGLQSWAPKWGLLLYLGRQQVSPHQLAISSFEGETKKAI